LEFLNSTQDLGFFSSLYIYFVFSMEPNILQF
jgi:hypothetical protein